MKKVTLLVASDIHGKENIVDSFVDWVNKMNHEFDAVVIAGDIGNPQKPHVFCNILGKVSTFKKPIYYVQGNWDVNYTKCEIGINLGESEPIDFGNFILIGHGKVMRPHKIQDKSKPIVLVTHYPPYSIMDRGKRLESSQQSLHSGLPEINFLVNYYKPLIHIFGHSHSFGGIDWKINGVIYVNVARLDRTAKGGTPIGNYALITIENKSNIKIDWFFINGIWKNCSLCGKRYHLPKIWSICRKCANRNDLKFIKIDEKYSKLRFTIYSNGDEKISFTKDIDVPVYTLKDYLALEDFLDILMMKMIVKELEARYEKVLVMPKDKLIEFYGSSTKEMIIPFSEYLFSCNDKVMGKRLCTLMKLFSLSKHVYVIWGFKNNFDGKYILKDEYVLFNEKLLEEHSEIEEFLKKSNFIPLIYKRVFRQREHHGMSKKLFENLRKILEKKK